MAVATSPSGHPPRPQPQAWRIRPPWLPKVVVARQRLLERLPHPEDGSIVTVVGPPGSGKSVLVGQWVRSLGPLRAGWLTLERSDDDPASFWPALVAALRVSHGEIGDRALAMAREGRRADDVLDALLADLHGATRPSPAITVLDDVHLLTAPALVGGLGRLARNLPASATLIVISRRQPALGQPRLRASGRLVEIRSGDLAFDVDEANDLLDALGLDHLEGSSRKVLQTRTEGWVAGLQLAAAALADLDRSGAAQLTERFAGDDRAVDHFLVSEVLDRQAPRVRRFLLDTSVLERLSGPSCDAVTGRHDGDGALRGLEAANLFVVALDNTGNWYRYHHLFREFLQNRLRRNDPARAAHLHVLAAEWYEAAGDVSTAIRHFAHAGRTDDVWRVIIGSAGRYSVAGRHATVRCWLESLPSGYLRDTPERFVQLALAFQLGGMADEAAHWARAGRRAAPRDSSVAVDALTVEAFARSYWGDGDGTVRVAEQALEGRRAGPSSLTDHDDVPTWLHISLVNGHLLRGDLPAARQALDQAPMEAIGPGGASYLLMQAADVACRDGDLVSAKATLVSAERLLPDRRRESPLTADYSAVHGWLSYERNELATAERSFERARRDAEDVRLAGTYVRASVGLAQSLFATRRPEAAFDALDQARMPLHRNGLPEGLRATIDAAEASLHIRTGNLERAADNVDDLPDGHVELPALRAKMAIASGRPGLVASVLQGDASSSSRHGAQQLALLALAAWTQRDRRLALQQIRPVLMAGRRHGWARMFVDLGPGMVSLLHTLELDAPSSYVRSILSAAEEGRRDEGEAVATTPLSDRERAVLSRLATHATAAEIARDLVISPNTFKTQRASIYRKLGVASRSGAVERARTLRLL